MTRYLMLLAPGAGARAARRVTDVAGLRLSNTADLGGAAAAELLSTSDGLLLHDLDVAVLNASPDQARALTDSAGEREPIITVEPERTVHAITEHPRRSVESSELTWGLRAIGVPDSTAGGAGVRVGVLDTGMTVQHPDFADREVVTNSFVSGDVADGDGHGTHVIGTACGPRAPEDGRGYGVAHESEIYAGKVLDDSGSGSDGDILAGISWAVANGCRVVSLSLGSPAQPDEPYSRTFEEAARRAITRGTLPIAAAGNESRRSAGVVAPVGHPANCPSIMAVAAVDADGDIADFSSGTVGGVGAVDIAGPGVEIHSSWLMPQRYNTLSGTSMATPHVSGVAALLAERYDASGWQLWARLCQSARRSPLPSVDVGSGLVQAPPNG